MYLLPKEHTATKKIMESPTLIPCDIYADNANDNTKQQVDDFMRFVEAYLNKNRKIHCQRSTRVSLLATYFFVRLVNIVVAVCMTHDFFGENDATTIETNYNSFSFNLYFDFTPNLLINIFVDGCST